MKKIFAFVLTLVMIFSLAACGNRDSSEGASSDVSSKTGDSSSVSESTLQTEESSELEMETNPNALIVYFSWSGNTEAVANEIQTQTGADIFEITPAEPYTDDYNALLDIAQEEQANDARPAIAGTVEDFAQYDVIYFGFPKMQYGI